MTINVQFLTKSKVCTRSMSQISDHWYHKDLEAISWSIVILVCDRCPKNANLAIEDITSKTSMPCGMLRTAAPRRSQSFPKGPGEGKNQLMTYLNMRSSSATLIVMGGAQHLVTKLQRKVKSTGDQTMLAVVPRSQRVSTRQHWLISSLNIYGDATRFVSFLS